MTTLTKLVNGIRTVLTTGEATARSADEVLSQSEALYEAWHNKIREADAHMPRYIEDTMSVVGFASFPQIMQERYTAKQILRTEKPAT